MQNFLFHVSLCSFSTKKLFDSCKIFCHYIFVDCCGMNVVKVDEDGQCVKLGPDGKPVPGLNPKTLDELGPLNMLNKTDEDPIVKPTRGQFSKVVLNNVRRGFFYDFSFFSLTLTMKKVPTLKLLMVLCLHKMPLSLLM